MQNRYNITSPKDFLSMQKLHFATILLSESCNANCPHCINAMQRDQKTHMDEEKLRILVENLLSKNFFNLKLLGGEPTIHPNFVNLYSYFQKKFTNVTLFSNALNDNIKKIIPRPQDYITYNGYFVNSNFDTDKFLPDNPFHFLRTIQNVVNMSFNFDEFKERALFVRDFFHSRDIRKNYVMALSLDCTEDIFSHAKEINKILIDIMKFLIKNKVTTTTHRNAPICFLVDPELIKIREQLQYRIFPSHICDVIYGQAIIDTEFNLKYCDRMPQVLGNVFKNDTETIGFKEFKTLMYKGFESKMKDNYDLKCKGCKHWKNGCNGGCYANLNSSVFDETTRAKIQCNVGE